MSEAASPSCGSCKAAFGFFSKGKKCGGCGSQFCGKCCYRYLLLEREDVDLTVEADDKQPVPVCQQCFVTRSSLDYDTHVDKYGTPGAPGMVLIHGNMATRKMLSHFAREMIERHGPMRIYCIDLPKHGTRYEEELTMETAVETVREAVWDITKEYIDVNGGDPNRYWAKGKKPEDADGDLSHRGSEDGSKDTTAPEDTVDANDAPVSEGDEEEQHGEGAHGGDVYEAARPFVMGYSMGGYVTIAVAAAAEQWKRKIAGAIVGGAGANMNAPGMGLGLSMFNLFAIKMKTGKALSVALQNQFPKIPLHNLQECFYRVGTYHDVWPFTQKLLTGTDYCAELAKVKCPLLIFRGAKDFKDADKGYLKAAPHAQLCVIPKGDHMCFMHYVDLSVDGIFDWMSGVNQ